MVLVLAATPIGRVEDASPRLAAELAAAEVIAAEDTRRLRRLGQRLGVEIDGRVMSYFEANEHERTPALLRELVAGRRVVLVTDAGMPSVSDPGFRLVQAAVAAGVEVTVVPGPSAVLAALAVSGLAVDRFCFEGFLPRKPSRRAARLQELAREPRTMVFFEAPHRARAALEAMTQAFGADRHAVACRELTKTHEEVRRGTLAELVTWAAAGIRGELTLVVAGLEPPVGVVEHGVAETGVAEAGVAEPEQARLQEGLAAVRGRLLQGERLSTACATVARELGLPRRRLYAAAVADAQPS